MAERSMNTPLSMGEVEEAIIFRIREAIRRDCNWNRDLACNWFEARVSISVKHADVGREVDTKFDIQESKGVEPAAGAEIEELETELNMEIAPPNQVRVETGQGVPVLTTASGKPEIKRVTYKKPGTFERRQ